MKHVIFDLDGTLIDSKQEIMETYRKVFLKFPPKVELNLNDISFTATLEANLNEIYKDDRLIIPKAKMAFSDIYDNSSFFNTNLYKYVNEVLQNLHENNIMMHVATNKRLEPTLRILELKNIKKFFVSILGSNYMKGSITTKEAMVAQICKENKIERGFMVGDSYKDIEAGAASGLITVAVTYGYESKELLLKKKPDHIIDSFFDLLQITKHQFALK